MEQKSLLHYRNDTDPKYSSRPLIKNNNFSRLNKNLAILWLLLPQIQTEFSHWNLEKGFLQALLSDFYYFQELTRPIHITWLRSVQQAPR